MGKLGVLAFALIISAWPLPSQAQQQQAGPFNRSATDDCEAEANRLFRMRDLEMRMKMKREHIAKCRAAKRGGTAR